MIYPEKPRYLYWAFQIFSRFGCGGAIGQCLASGESLSFALGLFLLAVMLWLFGVEIKDAFYADRKMHEKNELMLKLVSQGNNINDEEFERLQILMCQGWFSRIWRQKIGRGSRCLGKGEPSNNTDNL